MSSLNGATDVLAWTPQFAWQLLVSLWVGDNKQVIAVSRCDRSQWLSPCMRLVIHLKSISDPVKLYKRRDGDVVCVVVLLKQSSFNVLPPIHYYLAALLC